MCPRSDEMKLLPSCNLTLQGLGLLEQLGTDIGTLAMVDELISCRRR